MFTLTQWIILGMLFVIVISASFCVSSGIYNRREKTEVFLTVFLTGTVVLVIIGFLMNWYNTSTASGIRGMKDYKSELENGIDREITIIAEDGREIFYYEGKVDVESDHTDNYIKFESEEGKRYIIYYGIQDTVKIIEK